MIGLLKSVFDLHDTIQGSEAISIYDGIGEIFSIPTLHRLQQMGHIAEVAEWNSP